MKKDTFIQKYKKSGHILMQNVERKDKDGDNLLQYVPHQTVSTFETFGWVRLVDVPIPAEYLKAEAKEIKIIEQTAKPKGRPKKAK